MLVIWRWCMAAMALKNVSIIFQQERTSYQFSRSILPIIITYYQKESDIWKHMKTITTLAREPAAALFGPPHQHNLASTYRSTSKKRICFSVLLNIRTFRRLYAFLKHVTRFIRWISNTVCGGHSIFLIESVHILLTVYVHMSEECTDADIMSTFAEFLRYIWRYLPQNLCEN